MQSFYKLGCSDFEIRETVSLAPRCLDRAHAQCSICIPGRSDFKGKWKLRVFKHKSWGIRQP